MLSVSFSSDLASFYLDRIICMFKNKSEETCIKTEIVLMYVIT